MDGAPTARLPWRPIRVGVFPTVLHSEYDAIKMIAILTIIRTQRSMQK